MCEKVQTLFDVVEDLGGVVKAAEAFNEPHYQTIQDWVRKKRVPSNKVRALHEKTKIPLNVLNPELYG